MATFVLIEYTTDHRHPEAKLQFTTSERRAKAWVEERPSTLAFPGAANKDLPPSQQNWHHRLREAWEMPHGWRRPSKQRLMRARGASPWNDRRSDAEIMVSIVMREGSPVSVERGGA